MNLQKAAYWIICTAFAAWPAPSKAYFISGNDLWEFCDPAKGEAGKAGCSGFILGVVDGQGAFTSEDAAKYFCIPEGVQGSQLRAIVTTHLQTKPATRHQPAAFLITEALMAAYPCRK
jgi:hypothetical protein